MDRQYLQEILLGWDQCHGVNYEYCFYCLLWRYDKESAVNESGGLATNVASDLYDCPLVCERMQGESGTLLNFFRGKGITLRWYHRYSIQ